ncbi:MAG: iron-containing alcohol dehydrogenase [Sedimentisphaerales bacterium]|nr:iron-containing alcohol dehydrogenase [Sedimentisphaerales bacterium]
MSDFDKARELLRQFKGESYLFGKGILADIGKRAARAGNRAALIRSTFKGSDNFAEIIKESLHGSGVELAAEIKGPRPNCPREDLFRITEELKAAAPDVVISFGGGSTIDAAKAAEVLAALGGTIDDYFGMGLVTDAMKKHDKTFAPHIAIQTAAGSAAHLTKYSNITDISTGQKKLIVDDAIVPAHPAFDYEVTYSAPESLTLDGAFDGVAHSLEVLYGAVGKPVYNEVEEVASTCIALVVKYLPRVIENPQDEEAREALCLATDLGGYAIMIGGTNGGHLTSFSLVDVLTHGRACALMNPYYTVFFAPAIEKPLRLIGKIYQQAGLTKADLDNLRGRELGVAVAEAMFELAGRIGFPARLGEVDGFSDEHINRALTAAKNPQLKMKLQNMPIPLTAAMVDEYMGPILEAARDGNLNAIKNVS